MVFSASAVAVISLALVFLRSSSGSVKALATNYTNISEAYENYGFVYCFANSIIDVGISKPDDYSEQSVNDIINKIDDSSKNQSKSKNSDDKPNIIMIQLESFFDVDYMKGLKSSEDPLPVFHELTKNYSSGLLTVPTVGAGTVNTEFEVLTGMRQRDFGACEYPYKTVLRNMTSESICNDLSKIGYTSHCVHNNSATFYGRNDVFKNLGFDTFTSMEYMNGLQENPNGWVNDDVIAPQIIKTLDSTEGADFTFGITVQSHGKYDVEADDYEQKIKVSVAPEGMEKQYNYYVNEIAQVDKMLGNLIKRLENRNEKTVLVLYGDHLPSLDIKADELKNSDLYQTQYVIWDNFGLKKSDKDMAAYQLYSYVLNKIGIHEGLITKYHQQTDWESDSYLSGLKTLEYDWFYGDKYAYGGMNEFEKTDLQMGTYPVVLENVKRNSKGYIVKGKGFTDYTYIYFGGSKLEGYKIDSSHYQITDNIEYDEDEGYMSLQMAKENNVADEDIPNTFMAKVIDADNVELSSSKPLLWNFTSLYLE
jgi:phosphoglycerol transferase and related proteins, alkaline phosphatase superfamily